MRKAEYKIPFSKSFELSREVTQPICSVTIEPGQINYRAVSKRRLDLRGVLMLRVRLYDAAEQPAVSQAEGQGVQLLRREYPGARLEGQSSHRFSLAEQLATAVGKEPATEVVQIDCPARGAGLPSGRRTRGAQKGSFWSTCSIRPTPKPARWKAATIPCRSASSSRCPVSPKKPGARRRWPAFRPNAASMNLKRGSGWRCSWPLSCAVFPPSSSPGRSTAFRPSIRPRTPSKACGFRAGPSRLRNRISVRCEAPLPEGAQSLLDVWAAPGAMSVRNEDGSLTLTGQLTFTMLTQGGELGLDSASQTCDVSAALPQKGEGCELLPEVTVLSASGTIAQGKVQLSAELLVTGLLIEFTNCSLLTDLTVDEEHPRTVDRSIGLMIYYAAAGESVWEIAKRYGALPGQVMADNDLVEETLEADTPLMIPTACVRGE